MSQHKIQLISPSLFTKAPAWPHLHAIILQAYKPTRPNWPLPEGFQRLDTDPTKAGTQLCEEIGKDSLMAIALAGEDDPIGCAALQRFKVIRQWDVDGSAPPPDADAQSSSNQNALGKWELTLVTVASPHRSKGIARELVRELENHVVREHGKAQLMVRTVDEISGGYWRKLGFLTMQEYCIFLPKGFSHVKDAPDELRMQKDVKLWTGMREIG